MSALDLFQYGATNVRVIVKDGEPWFVAADICAVLEHSNPSMAIAGLDEDEKGLSIADTLGGGQQMAVINESGLYSLILRSRKPEAKQFKRWITHEVIPAIRRTGSYGVVKELSPDEIIAKALTIANDRVAQAEARAAELEAPARAWTELACAEGDWTVSNAAKVLCRDHHVETGPRKLFDFLEQRGWIFRRGGSWHAMQSAINAGLMAERLTAGYIDQTTGERKQGDTQVRVTAKGLEKLQQLLGEQKALVLP